MFVVPEFFGTPGLTEVVAELSLENRGEHDVIFAQLVVEAAQTPLVFLNSHAR